MIILIWTWFQPIIVSTYQQHFIHFFACFRSKLQVELFSRKGPSVPLPPLTPTTPLKATETSGTHQRKIRLMELGQMPLVRPIFTGFPYLALFVKARYLDKLYLIYLAVVKSDQKINILLLTRLSLNPWWEQLNFSGPEFVSAKFWEVLINISGSQLNFIKNVGQGLR